ncbi:hypothetical protein EI983_09640 [Roseovarius faecimaris]|uniref:Uncharacterized protein n=1 Tax=Roseovarius faecimaris TaxID=2494550 RepID=A0A6I6IPA4_9RHOB|nr:DUF6614 family protein [Roseovarius faecimaris]QGX98525.1 hypothetical protein EI983_09640 [Roseovarius faecimaris]
MNLYCVQIDLKQDAKALHFAAALATWLNHLQSEGVIGPWCLMRRKLNLAADCYRDFFLEIEFNDLASLDAAFHATAHTDDHPEGQMRMRVHDMIDRMDFALYRPYPDPAGAERMSFI